MSLKINVRPHVEHGRHAYGIYDVEYPGKPIFSSQHRDLDKRNLLPNGRGFSFNMEPPYASFKTIRALYNSGCGELAERCYSEYHRSWITPDYVWDGVMNYNYPTKPRLDDKRYMRALDELREQISVKDVIPMYAPDLYLDRIPRSTSPGLPFLHTHPSKKKGDILESSYMRIEGYWQRVRNSDPVIPMYDCAAFARSHISKKHNKVRPVWAYPLHAIVGESTFSFPILDELIGQRCGRNTAYGMEMMKGGMEWLDGQMKRANMMKPGMQYLMTDYSAFDSTVPAWLIRDVFGVLAEKFDFSKLLTASGVVDVSSAEYKLHYRKIVNYFINTPIRNSDGRRFLKSHGIPSGSMFTNIIGTFINFVVSRYLVRVTTGTSPIFDVYFGDDAFIALNGAIINIDKISSVALDCFGLRISTEKSYWTTVPRNVHFLGYYNCFGTPFKPTMELIASMIFPQYMKDDWSYCLSRALGCLLASAGTNRDVFIAARAVYQHSLLRDNAIEDAMAQIENNPRIRRHLSNMGYDDVNIGVHFFEDIRHSVPNNSCTKIIRNIDLI